MKSILLAGGSGTRLWPLSRSAFPKQFVKLPALEFTLFQMVYRRCLEVSKPEEIYIVCGKIYQSIIINQIEGLGIEVFPQNILLEPQAKNTLPAIAYAVSEIHAQQDDIVGVFPTDHMIGDPLDFTRQINQAIPVAQDHLVTFGIVAKYPETGYGYIKPGQRIGDVCFAVDAFKEKPNLQIAEQYVKDGYFWNSGMFMFHSKLFLEELELHAPEVFKAFQSETVLQKFELSPKISIDFGLLEKTSNIAVLPLDIRWNDLGNFPAFVAEYPHHTDGQGNIAFNNEILIDAKNNLLFSDSGKVTAAIGVENLVIVDQPDALLICSKDSAQKVKDVVDQLVLRKDARANNANVSYKAWGSAEVLSVGTSWFLCKLSIQRATSIAPLRDSLDACVTLLSGEVMLHTGCSRHSLVVGSPFPITKSMLEVKLDILSPTAELLILHTSCTQGLNSDVYKEV